MVNEPKPDNPSSDYSAMSAYWEMVSTILAGTEAMRKARERYLPKFEAETQEDYDCRVKNAPFTNIYRDIVEGLAAKPFAKELGLVESKSSDAMRGLAEDIDGRGNNLHVFGGHLFFAGINDAVTWILVDKTRVGPEVRSRADEQRAGARPYWVHIPACRLVAVYSVMKGSQEVIVHARILEPAVIRDGFGERSVKRVRIFNREVQMAGETVTAVGPPTFTLMEERKDATSSESKWEQIDQGALAIDVIPLVPFITGRRMEGSWRFVPPMQDAAFLQIEHYQQESGLKYASDNTAFPMLAGNGVSPPTDPTGKPVTAPIGPKRVLYAPPTQTGTGVVSGSWDFIEPTGTSLTFLANQLKERERQLRELGRQPLTADSGNLTVVTTAFAASKGNSAVQAWVINLKDALEQALQLTARWQAESVEPEVSVHTDFAIDMESDQAGTVLLEMRRNKDISRAALIEEAKRRDWLSPEYDEKKDLELILAETPTEAPDDQEEPPTNQNQDVTA